MAGALAVGYGTLGLFFRPFDKGCSLVVDSLTGVWWFMPDGRFCESYGEGSSSGFWVLEFVGEDGDVPCEM